VSVVTTQSEAPMASAGNSQGIGVAMSAANGPAAAPTTGVVPAAADDSSPKVSVCVPVHNGADTIERSIDSVLAQTYTEFECVVVDNDSSDATVERILGYRDRRIRLVRNETNLGGVRNHNKCVSVARGELIQFAHADDWLLPHCLETLVPLFDANNVGLAFAPRRVVSADESWKARYGRLEGPLRPLRPVNKGSDLVRRYLAAGGGGNPIGEPTSVMVRRATLIEVGGFRPQTPLLSDIDLWLRVLCRSDAAFVEDELTVRWHHDAGSQTGAYKTTYPLNLMWVLTSLVQSDALSPRLRLRALTHWLKAGARVPKVLLETPRGLRARSAMSFVTQAGYLALGRRLEFESGLGD
jgi:cellulose synthase/poly-beta-1,6-N-acetylglucosamine synthase-like glycosyltransferase